MAKVDIKEVEEYFYKYYIDENGTSGDAGMFIPIQNYYEDKRFADAGDGTCNMAHYLQYLIIKEDKVRIKAVMATLQRLIDKAYSFYKDSGIVPPDCFTKDNGFFLRDDITEGQKDEWESVKSASMMLRSLANEDPCYSPFVSQDQVWNLSPALTYLASVGDEDIAKTARILLRNINYYIVSGGYTLYNPYLSQIKHFMTYLPPFDVEYWTRQEYRLNKYKPTIKVKRGANNWYYSGATKRIYQLSCWTSKPSLRIGLYKATCFVLDRIWEPILMLFGKEFKHNSLYCYGASGIWYADDEKFRKRLAKRFNQSIQDMKDGKKVFDNPFEWNIAFLFVHDLIDIELVQWWIDNYEWDKTENGLPFMTACAFMDCINE